MFNRKTIVFCACVASFFLHIVKGIRHTLFFVFYWTFSIVLLIMSITLRAFAVFQNFSKFLRCNFLVNSLLQNENDRENII